MMVRSGKTAGKKENKIFKNCLHKRKPPEFPEAFFLYLI